MKWFPISITGKRIQLRLMLPTFLHRHRLLKFYAQNEQHLSRFWETGSSDNIKCVLKGSFKLYVKQSYCLYGIYYQSKLIGEFGIDRINSNTIHNGIAIAKDFTGKGFARETHKLVEDYARKIDGLKYIKLMTDSENYDSRKSIEGAGYSRCGLEFIKSNNSNIEKLVIVYMKSLIK